MPHLFKKSFVRPKSAPGSQPKKIPNFKNFKTPLLAKENIDKILQLNGTMTRRENLTACYSQPNSKRFEKDQIIASSASSNIETKKLNLPKPTQLKRASSNASSVSVHLSFEDGSEKVIDDSDKSNLSYRMNEPNIKDAYLQFVKKLSQTSTECKLTSSPKSQESVIPLSQKSPDMFATPEEPVLEIINTTNKPPLIDNDKKTKKEKAPRKTEKPFLNQNNENGSCPPKKAKQNNNKAMLNEKNEICMSQELLNQADVKAIYINFMSSSIQNEEDIIKPRKVIGKKKRNVITSSDDEESPNKTLEKTKKTKTKSATNDKKNPKRNDGEMDNEEYYNTLPVEERMALIQESRNVGLYVLCDICDKARYLPNVKDPLDLPDKWYCAMHPDDNYNKCSYPEEMLPDQDYLIDNLYNAGSIVWAKMDGYPWWPAMVEDDVDTETYFWLDGNSNAPTWYHVTFFDSADVTRAWMRPSCLKPFKMNMNNPKFQTPEKNKHKSRVSDAIKQAKEAIHMPLIDRLKKFSFIYRYSKPLNTTRRSALTLAEKKVKEKRRNKSKKAKKNLLFGHTIYSSKEGSRSSLAVRGSMENRPVNNKGDGPANAGDFSIISSDLNWVDTQNLSFNLLD